VLIELLHRHHDGREGRGVHHLRQTWRRSLSPPIRTWLARTARCCCYPVNPPSTALQLRPRPWRRGSGVAAQAGSRPPSHRGAVGASVRALPCRSRPARRARDSLAARLSAQVDQARREELARAETYYDAALASIARRRVQPARSVERCSTPGRGDRTEQGRRLREIGEQFRPGHKLRPFRYTSCGRRRYALPCTSAAVPRPIVELDWLLGVVRPSPICAAQLRSSRAPRRRLRTARLPILPDLTSSRLHSAAPSIRARGSPPGCCGTLRLRTSAGISARIGPTSSSLYYFHLAGTSSSWTLFYKRILQVRGLFVELASLSTQPAR
jgi:hypothetical protein